MDRAIADLRHASLDERQALRNLRVRVDGPYGVGRLQCVIYPLTVLVAGGIGITPCITRAFYIMQQAELAGDETTACHVHLVWTVREKAHLEWFADEIKAISDQAAKLSGPVTFGMSIYVTGGITAAVPGDIEREGKAPISRGSKWYDSLGPIVPARPNMLEVFQDLQRAHPGLDALVNVCGPRSLVKSVRMAAVRVSSTDGIFYVEEESFEF